VFGRQLEWGFGDGGRRHARNRGWRGLSLGKRRRKWRHGGAPTGRVLPHFRRRWRDLPVEHHHARLSRRCLRRSIRLYGVRFRRAIGWLEFKRDGLRDLSRKSIAA